ncbi:MAG: aldo/keto reductase [Candidatus Electryonea clarkiae]|nr:aldo/keto reductase [Candidatus Electryonea clarkiae]MDP8287694.1 aldo/keto reductase [Candidatus Electryonea clarkiae]
MKLRQVGKTDLFLSEVGFGSWAIGGPNWAFGWGPQNEAEAVASIRRARELEVNWIDTAAIYGLGRSEELVAKAVKGHRKEVIIATKCSLLWDEAGNLSSSLDGESVRRECEMSLKRLNTDFIDIYHIHWPNDDARIEEGWLTMHRMMEEGKIRYGGVSNFSDAQIDKVKNIGRVATSQPPYSMFRRQIEDKHLQYCSDNTIGILAYSPLHSGLLTGKFNIRKIAQNDWRLRADEFKEPNLSINLKFVKSLSTIVEKYNKTMLQFAIAWVLRLDGISSAIVGARRPSQVEEIVGGSGWQIEEEDLEEIDRLLEERKSKIKEKNGYLPM